MASAGLAEKGLAGVGNARERRAGGPRCRQSKSVVCRGAGPA